MNYYPHHIGDFNSATRHLTRLERGIYRDMLDLYYEKEHPLPSDQRILFRRLLIISPEEVTAAKQVLEDYFVLTEAGWHNSRCDREIEEYRAGVRSGNAGARMRAWGAAEKFIKANIEGGDVGAAETKLAEFVRKWGDTAESQACADLIARSNREAVAEGARSNRGVSADGSRLPNAETNQNHNQKQNQNQNQVNPQRGSTLGDGESAHGAAMLSVEFRKHGVRAQPADPRLIQMAAQGVTAATVAAACEEGRRSKGESISLGYVKSILERWSREAAQMTVSGARAPKPGHAGGIKAARMATITGLTGGSGNEGVHNIIDITPAGTAYRLG
ncbi:YdaU family protein [Pseudoduganella sp. HUAS MS19]